MWTEEEDEILINAQIQMGNKWSYISKLLPGRSENAVKNRYNSIASRNGVRKKRLGNFVNRSVAARNNLLRLQSLPKPHAGTDSPYAELLEKASQAISRRQRPRGETGELASLGALGEPFVAGSLESMGGQSMGGQSINGSMGGSMNGQSMNGQSMNGQSMNGQSMNGSINGQSMNERIPSQRINRSDQERMDDKSLDERNDQSIREPINNQSTMERADNQPVPETMPNTPLIESTPAETTMESLLKKPSQSPRDLQAAADSILSKYCLSCFCCQTRWSSFTIVHKSSI